MQQGQKAAKVEGKAAKKAYSEAKRPKERLQRML